LNDAQNALFLSTKSTFLSFNPLIISIHLYLITIDIFIKLTTYFVYLFIPYIYLCRTSILYGRISIYIPYIYLFISIVLSISLFFYISIYSVHTSIYNSSKSDTLRISVKKTLFAKISVYLTTFRAFKIRNFNNICLKFKRINR